MKFSSYIIKNSIVILRLEGRLDISNVAEFESLLDTSRKLSPTCNFILDLAGVEYLSSSALRVIVAAYRKLTEVKLSLVLLNPTSMCAKILEVTKLDDVIDIFDSEKEAINSFTVK
jgi:anti-sigma B factor antagonist